MSLADDLREIDKYSKQQGGSAGGNSTLSNIRDTFNSPYVTVEKQDATGRIEKEQIVDVKGRTEVVNVYGQTVLELFGIFYSDVFGGKIIDPNLAEQDMRYLQRELLNLASDIATLFSDEIESHPEKITQIKESIHKAAQAQIKSIAEKVKTERKYPRPKWGESLSILELLPRQMQINMMDKGRAARKEAVSIYSAALGNPAKNPLGEQMDNLMQK